MMQINVTFDLNKSSLPAGFIAAVTYAVNYLDQVFTNPVRINIYLGYGESCPPPYTPLPSNALGESYAPNYVNESYSSVRSALLAQHAPGASTLPSSSP